MSEAVSWPERLSKSWPFWVAVGVLGLLLVLNLAKGGKGNEEAEVAAPESTPELILVTRDFDTPQSFVAQLSQAAEGSGEAVDPFASEGDDESEAEARKVLTAQALLEKVGIPFPAGSYAQFSPKKAELTVHNTQESHFLVGAYLDSLDAERERLIQAHVRLYAIDTLKADALVRRTMTLPDHQELQQEAHALSKNGEASFTSLVSCLGRSGQRVLTQSGETMSYVESYSFEGNTAIPILANHLVGTRLELDSIIGVDVYTIDTVCALTVDLSEPEVRRKPMKDEKTGREYEVEYLISDQFDLTTSVTLWDGATRLIGVAPAKSAEGEPNQTMLVFLTMKLVKS